VWPTGRFLNFLDKVKIFGEDALQDVTDVRRRYRSHLLLGRWKICRKRAMNSDISQSLIVHPTEIPQCLTAQPPEIPQCLAAQPSEIPQCLIAHPSEIPQCFTAQPTEIPQWFF
jgi:hypothetical protein